MGYAVLHYRKIKSFGQLVNASRHNRRAFDEFSSEESRQVPANIDPRKPHKTWLEPRGFYDRKLSVSERLKERLKDQTIRKNAVLAVEAVFQPGGFQDWRGLESQNEKVRTETLERAMLWTKQTEEWLYKRFGSKNILEFSLHFDEKTPHIHALIVPKDEKGKLNCAGVLTRKKLVEDQTTYAEATGLRRGKRGSKARHTEPRQNDIGRVLIK
jgi:hypothetical protein